MLKSWFQLQLSLKQSDTDSNSIIEKLRQNHPEASLNVEDPLFLAEFTRILRKELQDAQILRKIDRGELNKDFQNLGYLSFETKNLLKLPNLSLKTQNTAAGDNIDQNRVFIEVIHDPSRCTPNHQYDKTVKSQTTKSSSNWIRSNAKNCTITSNSLFCRLNSSDKNTYSICVEHNNFI